MSKKKRKPKKTPEQVLRKLHLPTGGSYPFIPPKGWYPTTPLPRGQQHGYLDYKDHEWVPGKSITKGQYFEWDVQLADGGHWNIDWDGNKTHPKD